MDRETIWCVIGDTIPENCVEFFRAINDSGVHEGHKAECTEG